jgi:Ca2+-binding EF-hand superfamily protein
LIDRSKSSRFVLTFFDNFRKGYISKDDLKDVFEILGESITMEEVNTMIKIAGIKSNDKINFKEFVDFFYKAD